MNSASTPLIDNCTFTENYATGSGSYGGAIYFGAIQMFKYRILFSSRIFPPTEVLSLPWEPPIFLFFSADLLEMKPTPLLPPKAGLVCWPASRPDEIHQLLDIR